MSWLPINWPLLANPLNWVIVLLMVIIAGYLLHVILPSSFPTPNSDNG